MLLCVEKTIIQNWQGIQYWLGQQDSALGSYVSECKKMISSSSLKREGLVESSMFEKQAYVPL